MTPAAAFAIQQGVTYYPQVHHNCLPESGCYPLTPYHGLAVLAVYAAAALLLAATVALTAAVGAAAASSLTTQVCPSPAACHEDTVKLTLTGVQLSQALCLVLGVLSMGAEYSTGTIRTTLTAMPGRWRVLASKAATLSLLTAVTGALAVLSAVGLGFLYVVPSLSRLVNSPTWQHRLQRRTPMPAALSIQATKNLERLAIAPWPGLGVLAAYAVGLLVVGGAAFGIRDA